ncbi:class I tRNA ligase family protein [Vibrio lentus]|nr:class I tRNA ligase family protein [Vibrio lentus]
MKSTKDFAGFDISFDNYHSTHSEENRELASHIYLELKKRTVSSLAVLFLSFSILRRDVSSDRFVKVLAPKVASRRRPIR